jgi:diguanylate cyclase (GGDEF)-like protein
MEEARQSEVEYAAYHDVLTGLVNRAGMEERFGEMCAQATMETALAVMLVDLDGFKSVNDTFGHAAGDALLVQVASRLSESLRVDDLLVRLGGDEFAVCIKTDDAPDVAVRSAASRIVSELQRPFELGDISVSVGASVGVAVTHGGATVSDVLRDADTALYHVKENGKNAYRIFDTVLLDAVTMRRRIEKELAAAIRNGLLDVAYQPVVELTSGVEIGAEALCRWHHPALGDVPPSTFVPIAEETGLIGELGMLVLDKVLADMKTWPLTHVIAVNLSPKQLEDDHFVEEVAKRFGAAGVEPTRVELEVTETVLLENNPKMLNVLQSLKELGFGTALDDFGTGYSSLSYLKLFPFDRVKIDRSFVAEIASNEISAPIITAVAQLAHALNMRVTAEGVETGEQMEFVRDAGCDAAQGYYFGRPTTK